MEACILDVYYLIVLHESLRNKGGFSPFQSGLLAHSKGK